MKPKRLGKVKKLILTPDQHRRLQEYTTGQGGYQDLCGRVYSRARPVNGNFETWVAESDLARIEKAVTRPDTGGWQDLFREIMRANP